MHSPGALFTTVMHPGPDANLEYSIQITSHLAPNFETWS